MDGGVQGALSYLSDSCQSRLLGKFRDILRSVGVSCERAGKQHISFRAASIGDWGFCSVRGHGDVLSHGEFLDPAHRGYAILSLPISGYNHCSRPGRPFVGNPGELGLTRWDTLDDTRHEGDFHFIGAYIPVIELERWGGRHLVFDQGVDTKSGSGAICAALLERFTVEALSNTNSASLSAMLPSLAQACIATFESCRFPVANEWSDRRFQRIVEHLHARMHDSELSADSVARACGISQRQLYRLFADHGQTFAMTLRRIRLQEAAQRLVNHTGVKISNIAYDCGFESPTHFSRLFRATYGVIPKRFRAVGREAAESAN